MQEKLGLIPQTERPLLVPLLVMSGLILDSLRVIDTDGNAGRPSQLRTLIRAWKTAWRASRGKLPF